MLFFVVIVALLSTWLLKTVGPDIPDTESQARHSRDYYLHNFTATIMDEFGRPRYKLRALHLDHFPDDDSMILTQPKLDFYENQSPLWTVNSDYGFVYDGGKIIHLTGRVDMERKARPGKERITIVTHDLRIWTKAKYAETDAKVHLVQTKNTLEAVGMRIYLTLGELVLLSDVHGKYQSPLH